MRYEMHLSDENVHGRMLLRPAYDTVSRVPNMVTNKKKHKSNKGTNNGLQQNSEDRGLR